MNRPRMPGRPSDRHAVKRRLRGAGLHTVCEEAKCPNIYECFGSQTATFLILGNVCTRGCGFCGVASGSSPAALDPMEPDRLARAVQQMGLSHAVITSVTRDDLEDGGAGHFVACIDAVRTRCPETTIEVLVPDFQGRPASICRVLDARPEVFNHNVETVERLYPLVRPGADFERSLGLLARAAERATSLVKSGLMVGLGETDAEIDRVLERLAQVGCQLVTIGQYLCPTRGKLPVTRRVEPEQFERFGERGRRFGVRVVAGPLVRSSYRASAVLRSVRNLPLESFDG